MPFTTEELEEMRRADEEIEETFRMTTADYALSSRLDKTAALLRKSNREIALTAYQKAYYQKNREAIAAYHKAYRARKKQEAAL